MFEYFSTMKEKPRHVRTIYSFLVAFTVTGVIALFWVSTLPARFAPSQQAAVSDNGGLPIDTVANFLHGQFINLFSTASNMRGSIQYVSTTTPAQQNDNVVPTYMNLDAMVASSSAHATTTQRDQKPDTQR